MTNTATVAQPAANPKKTVGEIYSMPADKLDKFSSIPDSANRDILSKDNKRHLKELGEKIRATNRITPITVNERYQVLDGQNRLFWAKKLGMDLRFIIEPGAGIEYVMDENLFHRDWTLRDIVESFANRGLKDYIGLRQIRTQFNIKDITFAAVCLTNKKTRNYDLQKSIKDGSFKVASYEKAVADYGKVMDIMNESGLPEKGRQAMLFAALRIVRQGWYDHEWMKVKTVENSKQLRSCSTYNDYAETLLIIYNYGKKGRERVKYER